MIPNSGGTELFNNWAPGDQNTIQLAWEAYSERDIQDMVVVAILQDDATREVYGTYRSVPSVKPSNLVTGLENEELQVFEQLRLFPNPASDQVTVMFSHPLTKDYSWKLVNVTGQEVQNGALSKSMDGFSLSLDGVASGAYFIQIVRENRLVIHKKFMVRK